MGLIRLSLALLLMQASTSAGGQFLFENVQPGKYRLSATRNGYVRHEYGARSPNRPGLPITITPGQKITQVVLPLMPARTITGRVFDRDGEPLANVVVQALKYAYQDGQRILNMVQAAQTNDLGEYRLFWLNPGQYFIGATYPRRGNGGRRFGGGRSGNQTPLNEWGALQGAPIFEIRDVVPGSYEVVASLDDRNNRRTGRTSVEVGNSEIHNVTVSLSPGFTLPGRLTIEGTANISNMRVTLRPDLGRTVGGGPPNSTVQADGIFTLRQVGQDTYRVGVTGMPRNAYIKTARLGATDVLNEGLRVDRQPDGPLEIVISSNTGTVDATVSNERQEPSINVTVVLVPDPAHRHRQDLYRFGSTDAAGRLHLEGVPPGDYRAFAWEDVESGAWLDPDFIRQYEERGKPFRVGESGQANIELRIIPAQL